MRVAYPVTVAMEGILPRAPFAVRGGQVVLQLPDALAPLANERLNGRVKALGKLLNLDPRIEILGSYNHLQRSKSHAGRHCHDGLSHRLREPLDAGPRGQDRPPGWIRGHLRRGRKADFVVVAAIENGCIHLVEQYRYPVRGRYWELPQGAWENAPDADPVEVARGELREETGLSADEMISVGHLFQSYGYSTQGYRVFLARGLQEGATARDVTEQDMVARSFRSRRCWG